MNHLGGLALVAASVFAVAGCNKHVDPYAFDAGSTSAAPSAPAETASAPASAAPSAPATEATGDLAPLNNGASAPAAAPQGGAKPKPAGPATKPGVVAECEQAKSAICANPTGRVTQASCAAAKDACTRKGGKL